MNSEPARRWRILLVAYPLLPVTENSAGGAEQVLGALERELRARGHHTVVAAPEGSQVSGELFSTGKPAGAFDKFEEREREQSTRILDWLDSRSETSFDLIHDHSGSFWRHASKVSIPVLATLHLPRSFYPQASFQETAGNVFFNCVSQSQLNTFSDLPNMLGCVNNGITISRFSMINSAISTREYLLWIGRICEEKGPHIALDLAHHAGERIIIAGQVYPFLYHQKYFAREIIPRLKRAGAKARFINSPSFAEKADLLGNARALLLTSLVDETSSLIAMEAAACGTPVFGLRRGGIPEVVAEEVTGKLFDSEDQMCAGLSQTAEFDPQRCRRHAEEHFSARRMAVEYESLYAQVCTDMTHASASNSRL